MHAVVHAADVQDRDGGVLAVATLFGLYPGVCAANHPFLLKLYADSGCTGPKFQAGLARPCRRVNVEIVKRSDAGKFVVVPKRWIVRRTIAWLNRCRLAKDRECLNRNTLRSCNGRPSGSWCESYAEPMNDPGW
jgi:transposase